MQKQGVAATVPSVNKRTQKAKPTAEEPTQAPTDGPGAADAPTGIPAGHPYANVTNGSYAPEDADPDAWNTARPIAAALLESDHDRRPYQDPRTARTRLSALCRYLTWLAADNPELLTDPLDPDQIRRYIATDGMQRRSSHRSRTAIKSTLTSFTPAKSRPTASDREGTSPVSDELFERALAETGHFRNPVTRANTRALLLLSRAAGLDGADLRHVRGSDIHTIASAGTWINITNPKNARQVPVLTRYADQLEDLAAGRGERPMLAAEGTAPIDPSTPGQLAGMITRAVKRSGHDGLIQVSGLRKAWIAEQISSNAPLLTLMRAAGVNSLRAFEELLTDHAPLPPTNPAHIAYELGGITPRDRA